MIRISDKKLVVVCGDSWMSPTYNIYTDIRVPNQRHFSEILADKLNWDVICLGNVGFSNFGIVDQIKTAVSINPDLVIFNSTDHNRIELEISPDFKHHPGQTTYPILKYLHCNYLYLRNLFSQPDVVIPYMISSGIGVVDISHNYFVGMAENIYKEYKTVVRERINSLAPDLKGFLNFQANRIYHTYDCALMKDAISELKNNNIPFICMLDMLELQKHFNLFDTYEYIFPHNETLNEVEKENKELGINYTDLPHFHTTQNTQQHFADKLYELIWKRNLI